MLRFSRFNSLPVLLRRPYNNAFSSSALADPPTASRKSLRKRTLTSLGLNEIAPTPASTCYWNLSYGEIANHESKNEEGIFTTNGAFVVDTGKFTGRSPNDKYVVKQDSSSKHVWWGNVNHPMDPKVFDTLYNRAIKYYRNEVDNVYVLDGFCGAHEKSRRHVRFITEKAWHHHFVKNMFIRPSDADIEGKKPNFTVINCWNLVDEDWKKHGLNSEVFLAFNIEKQLALIGGAWYGGEMKKGIFSMMHYWLPMQRCLSMHCSANIGKKGDVCLFFGLSGTGKTTLSTDPNRRIIGDDEHGWDDDGIFNFEGGCYAKTSKLARNTEPEIYDAIRFNSLLENVWVDPVTRQPDYFNLSITENGRVAYPLEHIENREPTLCGDHPKYLVLLCADAFGVLPPIARLTPGQAMYHFVSGYTAKLAGTEIGIKEPVPNFSPCYGAAFLTLHPLEYAKLLKEKLEAHEAECFLVNTGWTGGPYGVGQRMSIKATRACLDAIFNGDIRKAKFRKDNTFLFDVPEALPGVDPQILNPRNTWKDKKKYDEEYKKLAGKFAENIALYSQGNIHQYKGCGPIENVL